MSSRVHDAWLWVGLTAFTLFAFHTVAAGRQDIYRLVETHEEPKKGGVWEVTQDTEDAVNATALFELAKSSNSLEIKRSAIEILVNRYLHDPLASAALWDDLTSKNPTSRTQARALATLLFRNGHLDLVREFVPRDTTTSFHGSEVIGAPLGRLSRLVRAHLPERAALETADGQAGRPVLLAQRRASHPDDLEELENRRRRREAIVLNEGDRPVTQDDIIQRRMSRLEEDDVAGLVTSRR